MSMEVALALIAVSPPITAIIVKAVPRRGGDFVSAREFDKFCGEVASKLDTLSMKIDTLQILFRSKR